MEIIRPMSESHPMLEWADRNGMTVAAMRDAIGVSDSYLRNILAGRREPSLRIAKRLSTLSGGQVPLDAFLRPEPVGEGAHP